MVAYATHFTKKIYFSSMDRIALSLNVLSTAHFVENLEDSHSVKTPTGNA